MHGPAVIQAPAHPRVWQPPGRHPREAVPFLRALAGGEAVAPAGWWQPLAREQVADEWLTWLRGHGLGAYAYVGLKKAGVLPQVAPGLQTGLRHLYYAAAGDAELHRLELTRALRTLQATGVTPVLFKGAVLAHRAYPDPACRPMGDIDLWLPAESMARAAQALQNAGYVQQVKSERPVEFQAQHGGEVQLAGTQPGMGLVELHYSPFAGEWVRRTTAIAGDCVACRAVEVEVAGGAAWALGAEDAILQLAVHMAVNHQMGYPGLRGLLDVALQARSEPPDWHVLAERAREWRVATATWLVLRFADAIFGVPGSGPPLAALRPSAGRQAVLSRFVSEGGLLAGRDLAGGPLRFAYQLFIVDRLWDATRLLGRTLWPESEWLALRYGGRGRAIRLRHLAAALRGRP